MQTPPTGSGPSNYPRPNLVTDQQILREIAISQRQIMYFVLAQFGLLALNMVQIQAHIIALVFLLLALAVALLVYEIIAVVRLSKALGEPAIVYAILMFIPCVSLVMLLFLSGKATTRLKQAGIKVGLMGADPNSI